jgi:two-component system alkaline phosphatase synthesis response regulator PhoP
VQSSGILSTPEFTAGGVPISDQPWGETGYEGPAAGDSCATTSRVFLVSPSPERIQGLILALYKGCYDLFVMHRLEPKMLNEGLVDLVILDLTESEHLNHYLNLSTSLADRGHAVPYVFLVKEQTAPEGRMNGEMLSWPSSPKDALTRIEHIIRAHKPELDRSWHRYKDLMIDTGKMAVFRGQAQIALTKTEYDILLHLVSGEGSVLTRETIMDRVWGSEFYGGSNVVDVHVKSLRKKLGDSAASPRYIVTVRGVGYRLADV